MSGTLSGSIAFTPEVKDQFQLIYGSFYKKDFISLYAKFDVNKNKKITKVELKVINYTDNSLKGHYYIKKAKFIKNDNKHYRRRKCPEISLDINSINEINCLTLKVNIKKGRGSGQTSPSNRQAAPYIMDEINIPIEADNDVNNDRYSYLEVTRKKDKLDESPKEHLNLKKCYDLYKNNPITGAGFICPRGYSRIFL